MIFQLRLCTVLLAGNPDQISAVYEIKIEPPMYPKHTGGSIMILDHAERYRSDQPCDLLKDQNNIVLRDIAVFVEIGV